jgi:hypothetical protein
MWSQVKNIVAPSSIALAAVLSVNEKRIAAGYEPVNGRDVFHSPQ